MQRRGGSLQRKVWIQLDNTCRENKNKMVVGFAQWIVAMGLCEEIRLSFLPVGYASQLILTGNENEKL